MAVNVQDARNFLLTTDFPLDKVIFLRSGSATINFPTAGQVVTITHGLLFVPLVSGSWSLDPSFTTSYEYGSGTFPSNNLGASVFNISMDIRADSTNIIISPTNVSGASFTLYWRVYAFEPSDCNFDLEPTASSADDFILNTDYNYTKLYLNDVILNATTGTYTVNHNLGYLPQVMAWVSDSGYTIPVDSSEAPDTFGLFVTCVVDTNTVSFVVPSFLTIDRIDYRIYLDNNA